MDKHTKGQIAILLCAVLWSTSGLFIKIVDWHPMLIAGSRSFIAALFMLAVKCFSKPREVYGSAPRRHFWGAAISYAACMILFMFANKMTTSANAILLQYSGPIWAALLGWGLAKEKPRAAQWVAIGAVIVGMLIFFKDGIGGGNFLGDCMAILSGIAFGAYSVFMRLQKDGNPADSMILSHVITAAVGLPFLFMSAPAFTFENIGAISFMGIFTIGLASVFFSNGIRNVSAVQALLLALIEPVLNPIWVLAATGEKPSVSALIGGGIIIIAVTASSLVGKKENNN
ncbi:MAG: DMT family transporter [Treponema sp.]|jgi:drug/metabolite transporter (DMT)-like permease|nr:DMT family transporter [Treponema sp.]